jgi:hypothetical protein
VLGVHRREKLPIHAHGGERRPRDLVLALVVMPELVVEVGPRRAELGGPRPVTRAERAERGDEPVEIPAYRAVDRLVHAHFGHAPDLNGRVDRKVVDRQRVRSVRH